MLSKPLRARKCRNPACRKEFIPSKPFITWCSPDCGVEVASIKLGRAKHKKERRERLELKEAKERIKSRGDWAREAQAVFNKFIKERDKKAGYGCISCGTKANVQYAAGHYRTVGSTPELRFDERNVHLQCNKRCNLELSGNILAYRNGLILRFGLSVVEWLESKHDPKHYSIEDLKSIKAEYKKKLKDLQNK